MAQIPSPFDEPQREESKGEAQQRLASLIASLLRLFRITPTEKQRDALATVTGMLINRWPWIKGVFKGKK
jgi:hypothetical protein